MRMDTVVHCECGHRVGLNELLAHGFVMIGDKPAHVYLKYRCAECGCEGVELVDYDRWNALMKEPEPAEEEVVLFRRLGAIGAEEILQFAEALANLSGSEFAELHSR